MVAVATPYVVSGIEHLLYDEILYSYDGVIDNYMYMYNNKSSFST